MSIFIKLNKIIYKKLKKMNIDKNKIILYVSIIKKKIPKDILIHL